MDHDCDDARLLPGLLPKITVEEISDEMLRLGALIIEQDAKAKTRGKEAFYARVKVGEALISLKRLHPHGTFMEHCRKFIPVSQASVATYMNIAREIHVVEATLSYVPEQQREEKHYSSAYALKAITGEPLFERLEEGETRDFRRVVSLYDQAKFVDAFDEWQSKGSSESVVEMMSLAYRYSWHVRDLLEDLALKLDDPARFAIEATRAQDEQAYLDEAEVSEDPAIDGSCVEEDNDFESDFAAGADRLAYRTD